METTRKPAIYSESQQLLLESLRRAGARLEESPYGVETAANLLTYSNAVLASCCEHAEHAESYSVKEVGEAAWLLLQLTDKAAASGGVDLSQACLDKMRAEEARSLTLYKSQAYQLADNESLSAAPNTWLKLQKRQALHNQWIHRDFTGLSPREQIRNRSIHLTASLQPLIGKEGWRDFSDNEGFLADLALTAISLLTMQGWHLDNEEIEPASGRSQG